MEAILFYFFATIAVIGALAMVGLRNPLSGAFALVVSMVALAALYAMMNAGFVFILQILVYAGAIMVLVIFTIMLLNLDNQELKEVPVSRFRLVGMGAVCALLAAGFIRVFSHLGGEPAQIDEGFGTIEGVGRMMLGPYLYPFEIISLVLLVAIVGVVLLAKRVV